MNRPTILMLIAAVTLMLPACSRDENARSGDQTATIERPAPRQDAIRPDELTQTVELDDGRSVDEGESITEPESEGPATSATATTTTGTVTSKSVPPAKTPPPPRKQ